MPYVNIKITDEGVTKEQKHQLIQGATQLLVDVLGKNLWDENCGFQKIKGMGWEYGASAGLTHLVARPADPLDGG